jgi:geranylgeranyl pyrophosphate synthase
MDWLKSLYPAVRDILWNATPEYWPELRDLVEELFGDALIPEVILPLAACKAAGGEAKDAVHVSAALVAAASSLRILDDLEDQDRPDRLWNQVGPARAWNYAAALQSMSFDVLAQASLAPDLVHSIISTFTDAFLHVAYGQDRDLIGDTRSIEAYWATVAEKVAYAYATACTAGAMIATDNRDLIRACGDFGFHLGFVIQVVNDMESISGERIKEILDSIDTRSFLIWSALKEREQALEAISICPDSEGKEALEAYVTGLFGDIESLLPEESG